MKLVIHIGMHKAASTSIQKFCAFNDELLKKHGVVAPRFSRRSLAHRLIAYDVFDYQGFSPIRKYDNRREEKRWMAKFEQDYKSACNDESIRIVFMSTETFETHSANLDRFGKLLNWLGTFARDVEFVAVVRDQASFANSLYCQRAKAFKTVQSFEEALPAILRKNNLDYSNRYRALFETDQKLAVIPFSNLVSEGVERYLIRNVFAIGDQGIYGEVRSPKRRNANPGIKTVAAGVEIRSRIDKKLNQETFPEAVRYRLKRDFLQLTIELGWNTTAFSGLDDNRARSIMSGFAEQNDAFARRVWGANWGDVYDLPKFAENEFVLSKASRTEQEEFSEVVQRMEARFDELLRTPPKPPRALRDRKPGSGRKRRNQHSLLRESLD